MKPAPTRATRAGPVLGAAIGRAARSAAGISVPIVEAGDETGEPLALVGGQFAAPAFVQVDLARVAQAHAVADDVMLAAPEVGNVRVRHTNELEEARQGASHVRT